MKKLLLVILLVAAAGCRNTGYVPQDMQEYGSPDPDKVYCDQAYREPDPPDDLAKYC